MTYSFSSLRGYIAFRKSIWFTITQLISLLIAVILVCFLFFLVGIVIAVLFCSYQSGHAVAMAVLPLAAFRPEKFRLKDIPALLSIAQAEKQYEADFAEFKVRERNYKVHKLERFQWLPYTEYECFLRDFDQHWKASERSLNQELRFRVVGNEIVLYDGCYFRSRHTFPVPCFGNMTLDDVIRESNDMGVTQIFPSL